MLASSEPLNYTILDVNSEDAEYVANNLKIYRTSKLSYRSLATSEINITIDLLTAYADPYIGVYNCNFTDIKYLGNDSDSWVSPIYDSTLQTIEQDPELGIYKHFMKLSGFNHRYIRVNIPVQSTTDGESYFKIGVMPIIPTMKDFDYSGGGFGIPVDNEIIMPEKINRFDTNNKEIIQLDDIPVIQFDMSGNFRNSVSERKKVMDVFGRPARSIVFMSRIKQNSWQWYILQRTSQISSSEIRPSNNGIKRYTVNLETIL